MTIVISNGAQSRTALGLITDAMDIAGVLGQNETPTSSEADKGLTVLNDMLALWSIDRTFIFTITQNTFPLISGQASYTIGDTGNFVMICPRKIDNVFIRISSVDYPLKGINNQDYDAIAYKQGGAFPQYFYYDADFPLGTLYLYGVPTQGDIYIDTWDELTQFTDLTTNLTFPPGYNSAIVYSLARYLAPRYGVSLTPEALQVGIEALAGIKDRNVPNPVMKTEIGYLVGNNVARYGWNSGY